MFSSPSMRVQNHENSDVIARKGTLTSSATRKAFQDRNTNCKIPQKTDKGPFKSKINVFTDMKVPEFKKPENKYNEWLLDTCKNQELKDDYMDVLPLTDRIKNRLRRMDPEHEPETKFIMAPEFETKILNEVDPMVFELPPVYHVDFTYLEVPEETSTFSKFNFDACEY